MKNVTVRFYESAEQKHRPSIEVCVNLAGDIAFITYNEIGEIEAVVSLNLETAIALSEQLDDIIEQQIPWQ
jgi:CMP-2-keto-3-deoxyoctulosonic acid synthetase